MASDMVERVERSIASILAGNNMPDMSGDNRNRLSPLQRLVCTRIAKAAIEAMREPTEVMVEAGCQARNMVPNTEWTDGVSEGVAVIERMLGEKAWQSMIDAALQESSHVR